MDGAHTVFGILQGSLWGLCMLLVQVTFSSAPVVVAPQAAYYAALLLGIASFVGLGVWTDRAVRACDPALLEVRLSTRIQVGLFGLLSPGLFVAIGTTWRGLHPTYMYLAVLGVPLAGVFAGIDRWSRVLWRDRQRVKPGVRRAGVLGLASALAWLVVPLGILVGDAFVVRRYG